MKRKLFTALLTVSTVSQLLAQDTVLNLEALQKEINILKASSSAMEADFESNAKSGFQLAGYAALNWMDAQGADNEFSGVQFAPIFHAQYGSIFQYEGEMEFSTTATGETLVELEYSAGTLFVNDYMGLQIGKFMSPIGQFVQNQHPSWINKMPMTPVGFGHDGAAPTSNVGIALRGGLPKVADIRSNYVLFVSNAPTYGPADDGDIVIDATGKTTSNDVSKTWGGRFALNPIGNMEIAVSGAVGQVQELNTTSVQIGARDYSVFGVDFMYNFGSTSVKAEYVQQVIGENSASTIDGGTWKAAYAQVSHQLSSSKFEPVLRYSQYENPDASISQWALGLNYLFANNLIGKVSYEYNKEIVATEIDNNAVRVQLAFGF